MLMRTEPSRRDRPRINARVRDLLADPDFIAVGYFAALGLLVTISLARIFPPEQAINLLMLFD